MVDLLEVAQPGAFLVARIQQRLRSCRLRRQHRRDAPCTRDSQALLQFIQQGTPDPPVAPPTGQRHHRDPGPIAVDQSSGNADRLVSHDGDDARLAASRTGHHFGYAIRGQRFPGEPVLLPDGDELVEIVVVEVTQPPGVHRSFVAVRLTDAIAHLGGWGG